MVRHEVGATACQALPKRRNQAVRIPVEFELPGEEAVMHREGNKLVIEPLPTTSLLQWLATIEPWDEEFPEISDEPTKPEDIF